MKVKDLIIELQKIEDQEVRVFYDDDEWGAIEVNVVKDDNGGYNVSEHIVILKK